jgi:hypothetical protein
VEELITSEPVSKSNNYCSSENHHDCEVNLDSDYTAEFFHPAGYFKSNEITAFLSSKNYKSVLMDMETKLLNPDMLDAKDSISESLDELKKTFDVYTDGVFCGKGMCAMQLDSNT